MLPSLSAVLNLDKIQGPRLKYGPKWKFLKNSLRASGERRLHFCTGRKLTSQVATTVPGESVEKENDVGGNNDDGTTIIAKALRY